jgi:uncharacterized protein (DUF1778 family)
MSALKKTQTLNLRIEPQNHDVLKRAAKVCGKSLSAFMMEAAVYSAQRELLDQRFVSVDASVFDAVQAQLDAPANADAELVRLFKRNPSWID